MDGWMDGWMDRWMDGWMNGWMDGTVIKEKKLVEKVISKKKKKD